MQCHDELQNPVTVGTRVKAYWGTDDDQYLDATVTGCDEEDGIVEVTTDDGREISCCNGDSTPMGWYIIKV